jgi:hypothetical protein
LVITAQHTPNLAAIQRLTRTTHVIPRALGVAPSRHVYALLFQ